MCQPNVNAGLRWFVEIRLHASDHSNNLPIEARELKALADWVLPRKEQPRCFLTDDGNGRRFVVVGCGQRSPQHQGYAHRPKIVGHHHANPECVRYWLAGDRETEICTSSQRQAGSDCGCRLYAGQRFDSLHSFVIVARYRFGGAVTRAREIDFHREEGMSGIESRVGI